MGELLQKLEVDLVLKRLLCNFELAEYGGTMDWTNLAILAVATLAYYHLLKVVQRRGVAVIVKLCVESEETVEITGMPRVALLTKICRFIVTPVPGMELVPAGLSGAVIKRVLVDEGLIEVVAIYSPSRTGPNFDQIVKALVADGWSK